MIETLVARIFATRDAVHLEHWRTKSFSQHEALGAFYGDLISAIDEIVEVYQGRKGLIGEVTTAARPSGSLVGHLNAEVDWIKANRDKIAEGIPSLANLLDEVHGTYARTIYKLRFLG